MNLMFIISFDFFLFLVKIVPSNEFTLWKEFDELQDSEDIQEM